MWYMPVYDMYTPWMINVWTTDRDPILYGNLTLLMPLRVDKNYGTYAALLISLPMPPGGWLSGNILFIFDKVDKDIICNFLILSDNTSNWKRNINIIIK